METQQELNYKRIAEAIAFYRNNFRNQPSLEEVASNIHLSPFHFQRMFKEWAGVTPKQFLQYISIEHSKRLLRESGTSLLHAAYDTGLSGTGRLHDLFIKIEGMTPGEFKNEGAALAINYSFAETPFGNMIVASTGKGICYMAFADNEAEAFDALKQHFPRAGFRQFADRLQQQALFIFTQDWQKIDQVKLHLKATGFQLKVWETLLKLPFGSIDTYGGLAAKIGSPAASRAVGTAVASNPIAYLIPCHRVVRASGDFGEYHWGTTRKTAILGWEAAKLNNES